MTETPPALRPIATIGFIGLGVMGEPMCGHLARRSGLKMLGCDINTAPGMRLAEFGVSPASLEQVAKQADLILLSLPDGRAVAGVIAALEPDLTAGQCIADTSTSSVALTREIGGRLEAKGILFAVFKIECRYKSPAYYDDELTLTTRIDRMSRARIDHSYVLRRGETVLCEASSTLACIDRSGKLIPIPDELFEASS